MAYRPGVVGRAIREGGAGIGRAISQLGEMRYRSHLQARRDAEREEERRYRRERDEFSRFAKGASMVGNAETIQEADALSRVYRPHLGKYGPALAELAAATPVPEGHARLPGVPGVTVRTPEFPGIESGVTITPGRNPRDFAVPELEGPIKYRGREFSDDDEYFRFREREAGTWQYPRAGLRGPAGSPSTFKVGGRDFPDTPEGHEAAVEWRERLYGGDDSFDTGGTGGGSLLGGGGAGIRERTHEWEADRGLAPLTGDLGRDFTTPPPGRENAPDPVAPPGARTDATATEIDQEIRDLVARIRRRGIYSDEQMVEGIVNDFGLSEEEARQYVVRG